MTDDYYDDIDRPTFEPWARVGWRQRIEQAYRFEAALELIGAVEGPVLDVGAGLGDLAGYADACGIMREFVAIEPRREFARVVRASGLYTSVIEAPFAEADATDFGCAVALGVLTAKPTATLHELAHFLDKAPASMFTVLDRVALEGRVALAAEHERAAVTRQEIEALPGQRTVVRLTTTDFAVFSPRSFAPRSVEERFNATIDGPWGGEPPATNAWLACEVGLDDEAERWLSRADSDAPLTVVVRERLRLR